MIRKLFQLVISSTILISADSCHNNFTVNSFEEASDSLIEFIDENFYEKGLLFFPKTENRDIKIENLYNGLKKVTVKVQDIESLYPDYAFNSYNDMLGALFYDYDYELDDRTIEFIPYERRVYYKNIYFGLSVKIHQIKRDKNSKSKSWAEIGFINYTDWVEEQKNCEGVKSENTTIRR